MLKILTDKGVVTHKHIVERMNDDKEIIDVNFSEVFDEVKKEEEEDDK